MKEKIEDILNSYILDDLPSGMVSELSTLIEQERNKGWLEGQELGIRNERKKWIDEYSPELVKDAVKGFITDFIETGVYEGVGSIEDIMKLWRKYNAHN